MCVFDFIASVCLSIRSSVRVAVGDYLKETSVRLHPVGGGWQGERGQGGGAHSTQSEFTTTTDCFIGQLM